MRWALVAVLVLVLAAAAVAILTVTGHLKQASSCTPAAAVPTTARPTKATLKIFCAGSLKIPLDKLASIFAERYGVEVHVEPSGSVEALRKVVDLKRSCDVLVVADYRLIPMYMVPKYAKWYVAFASNSIVLAFTEKSKYAKELEKDPSKWVEILARPDVRFGFSDPNKDPCGYRAVGVIALASIYYRDPSIIDRLLLANMKGVRIERTGEKIHIYVSPAIEAKGNLVIRPKSVDLVALLEAGELDYAFEYRSVAVQHGLKFIELPKHIDLSDPSMDGFYGRVVVHILSGTEREKEIPMQSIVYGVTVPLCAENRKLGLEFVKLLLGGEGRKVFESLGQPFLKTPLGFGEIPDELRGLVTLAGS